MKRRFSAVAATNPNERLPQPRIPTRINDASGANLRGAAVSGGCIAGEGVFWAERARVVDGLESTGSRTQDFQSSMADKKLWKVEVF